MALEKDGSEDIDELGIVLSSRFNVKLTCNSCLRIKPSLVGKLVSSSFFEECSD